MLGPSWGINSLPAPKTQREICQVAAVCHDCVQVSSQVGRGDIMGTSRAGSTLGEYQ